MIEKLVPSKKPRRIFFFCFLLGFVSAACGQSPQSTPKIAALNKPTLEEEVKTKEREPRKGLFEMNIRFERAKYSQSTPLANQYLWEYFKEADVVVNFSETAGLFFSSTSAEERKRKSIELVEATITERKSEKISEKDITVGSELGKQYTLILNGKTTFLRTFADKDTWYLILVQPKVSDTEQLIERLFDSFAFVEKSSAAGNSLKNN